VIKPPVLDVLARRLQAANAHVRALER